MPTHVYEIRRAATLDDEKHKPMQVGTKITKPRRRAMSHGGPNAESGDMDVQMDDCEPVAAECKIPRNPRNEANGPGNPANTSRSLPTSQEKGVPARVLRTEQRTISQRNAEAAEPRGEKQVRDVVIQLPPKEHARILNLESQNQKLRDDLQKKTDELNKLQTGADPSHRPVSSADIAERDTRISQLEADLAEEKARTAATIAELQSHVDKEKWRADDTSAKLQKAVNAETESSRQLSQLQRDKSKLESDLQKAQRDFTKREKDKENAIQHLNHSYHHEKNLRDKREKELTNLDKRYQAAERDRDNMRNKLLEAETIFKQNILDLHERLQVAANDNENLRAHIEQQELSVTKAQNAFMSVLSESASADLPDDRIRARFNELFEGLAEWARDNATQDGTIFESQEKVAKWHECNLLRRVEEFDAEPRLNFDMGDDTAVDTLLNAALASRICQDFLANPFWFAEDLSPADGVNHPEEEFIPTPLALERLLEKMMNYHEGQEEQVYAWRAATVKMLAGSPCAQEKIQNIYKEYLENDLLDFCKDLICDDIQQPAKDELLVLVTDFGSFAIELWSTKYQVRYSCLGDFKDRLYKESDEDTELARAVGVDHGDTSLDGRPIPCVVQPLIVGAGSNDGKDYEKRRVWSKAVVWVSKDCKPPATQAAKSGWRNIFTG